MLKQMQAPPPENSNNDPHVARQVSEQQKRVREQQKTIKRLENGEQFVLHARLLCVIACV